MDNDFADLAGWEIVHIVVDDTHADTGEGEADGTGFNGPADGVDGGCWATLSRAITFVYGHVIAGAEALEDGDGERGTTSDAEPPRRNARGIFDVSEDGIHGRDAHKHCGLMQRHEAEKVLREELFEQEDARASDERLEQARGSSEGMEEREHRDEAIVRRGVERCSTHPCVCEEGVVRKERAFRPASSAGSIDADGN